MNRNQNVFVTGGTGSVGRALVKAFSVAGYSVEFQFLSNVEAAQQLSNATGAHAVAMDLRKPIEIGNRKIDILINNAGVNICDQKTADVPDLAWDESLAINTTAPFHLVRAVLPAMMEQKWGRVINISSIYGLRAVDNNLPYTVSKFALSALTKKVAKEYAGSGITSNEICPGPIDSSMMERIARDVAQKEGGTPADYLKSVRDEIPAKRFARPEEIVGLALYLATDAAAYVNGASIPLDGGLIA